MGKQITFAVQITKRNTAGNVKLRNVVKGSVKIFKTVILLEVEVGKIIVLTFENYQVVTSGNVQIHELVMGTIHPNEMFTARNVKTFKFAVRDVEIRQRIIRTVESPQR